jgi:hypothetical protein
MAVRKIVLILWVLAAALGLALTIHFSSHAWLILEKCFATGLANLAVVRSYLIGPNS